MNAKAIEKMSTSDWLNSLAVISGLFAAGFAFLGTFAARREAKADKEEAKVEVAKASDKAAKAHERAAILEKETAAARLETERLKQLTSWRELSEKSIGVLLNRLIANPAIVSFEYLANDLEAKNFTLQLRDVFNSKGWQTNIMAISVEEMEFGLSIPIRPNERLNARIVRSAFREAGIDFSTDSPQRGGFVSFGTGNPWAADDPNTLRIIVGPKPRQKGGGTQGLDTE